MTPAHDHLDRQGRHLPTLPLAPGPPWPDELPSTLLPLEGGGSFGVALVDGKVVVETHGVAVLEQPEVRAASTMLLAAWSRNGGEPG